MNSRPSDEEVTRWHTWFAVECNNRSWQLAELITRTPAESQEMLDAAHAAAWHWSKVGTPTNAARAQMLLGHAHALAGDGQIALNYATASLNYFTAHETPDWELAFAHAVTAGAAFASGDGGAHAHHHQEAARLGAAIADAEDREIFMRTFRQVPPPGGHRQAP